MLLLLLTLPYWLHTGDAVIYWIDLPLIQVSVSWQGVKSPLGFFSELKVLLSPSLFQQQALVNVRLKKNLWRLSLGV